MDFNLVLLDETDMSEVDKLLEKARSVRVSAEPTEQKVPARAFPAKDSSIKTMKSNPKGLFVDFLHFLITQYKLCARWYCYFA